MVPSSPSRHPHPHQDTQDSLGLGAACEGAGSLPLVNPGSLRLFKIDLFPNLS